MTAGTLSADQQRYAQQLAAATGLDLTAVTAWIGAESGWGVTKATHNYLNVTSGAGGGFASYSDVDTAAARAAQLLNTAPFYSGVRAAVPAGGLAQVQAIAASPWDAGHYGGDGSRLTGVYTQLAATGGAGGGTATATNVDIHIPGTPFNVPTPADILGGLLKPVTNAAGDVAQYVVSELLTVGLTIVFTVFALALIGFGVSRLTSLSPKDALDHANTAASVANVAKLAAI